MSAAPNRFLHADAAGAYILPPTRPMKLPIRQNLNRLTALNRTERAVLIEVAGMAENGSQGAFTTDNAYLVKELGGSLRTISRALGKLEALGLLHSTGATKLRRITTTASLRVCYTGSDAEQFAAVEALNVALENAKESNLSIDKTGLSIDKGGSVYRQIGYLSIDNGGTVYSHSVPAYKETSKDQYKDQQKEEEGPLRSALSAAQKKIIELESALEEMTYQRNQLRASLLAQRPDPSGADASASHTRGGAAGHKIPFGQSKVATPEGFTTLATALQYPAAYAPHYLAHMAVKAGTETRDERGWQNFVQRYLANDATSETGLITTPPNDSAHATQRSTFSQRPVSGAKPTGAGAQLARSLAERRTGQH